MNLTREDIEKRNRILLECRDTYIISNFLNNLNSKFLEYDLEKYYNVDEFLEVINRGELFDSKRKIIVLMELDSDNLKIVSPLVNMSGNDILVFVEQKALSKTKLYTTFRSDCNVIKLLSPTEKECTEWVRETLNNKKMIFDRTIPDTLVKYKGADLSALDREIRKLEIKYGNNYISNKDCTLILGNSEAKLFNLVEFYLMKDVIKTIIEFDKIDESSCIKLVYIFISYIEKLYRVSVLREQGKTQDEVSEITGINKYFLRTKYYAILAVYNKIKLLKLLDNLNELDFRLRQNIMPNKLLTEAYLFKALKS